MRRPEGHQPRAGRPPGSKRHGYVLESAYRQSNRLDHEVRRQKVEKGRRFGTRAIHDETVYKLRFWLTSTIAAIMPVLSILLLVKMETLNGRLGIIAAFNVLVSICLTFSTEARRTDVFAVTAACETPIL
jgi:hypothetical protein